jgi:hypothetical protein
MCTPFSSADVSFNHPEEHDMTLAAMLPQIRVDRVRRIVEDGRHNGFTDMVRFGGAIYLTYRTSPSGHDVKPDSGLVILRSDDEGRTWDKVREFGPIPFRDLRDPHFLVFRDTLFVYAGAWIIDEQTGGHDLADHQGYAVWTKDGRTWQGPQAMKGTLGYYVWRCAAHGDHAFLVGRRVALADFSKEVPGYAQSFLLRSDDGLNWKPIAIIQAQSGNEVAPCFEEDGSLTALCRCRGEAEVRRAAPPYREWTRAGLGRIIGGPMLVKWNDRYLAGTRKVHAPGQSRTVLSWLEGDQLIDMVELPSGGDNSYTGFVPLSDTRGLVSYYSSHEGSGGKIAPCHIYLAEISLVHP